MTDNEKIRVEALDRAIRLCGQTTEDPEDIIKAAAAFETYIAGCPVDPNPYQDGEPFEVSHASDCAVHNAPALEAGDCNCTSIS